MKKWKRINNSDRKKIKCGKARIIVSGFMDSDKRIGKRKIMTVVDPQKFE